MFAMTGVMMYVWLIVGFVFLIKGADVFVEGSSSVAKILKVPEIVIGLTIVAMGTSAPESAVSISATLKGANEIAVGNVVGSNFFNLLAIVGICAAMKPISVSEIFVKRDFPVAIGITVLLLIFLAIGGNGEVVLSRLEGGVLLFAFIIYLLSLVIPALKNRHDEQAVVAYSLPKSIFLVVIGLASIIIGGNFVVDSATAIAKELGMSDTLIGLTIVAIGTSLPELVTSVVSAKKGHSDIAIGNILGSNIYNILFILGISGLLLPINVDFTSIIDTALLIVVHLLVFFIVILSKNKIKKPMGIFMILVYVAYTLYLIARSYGFV